MSSWYQTEKGWRRRKSSIYLRENVYAELVKVADRNKLSFSRKGELGIQYSTSLSFPEFLI